MERALIENCLKIEPDLFALVVMAAHRAQELAAGMPPKVPFDNNKYPVVALRELAADALDLHALKQRIVSSYRQFSFLSSDA